MRWKTSCNCSGAIFRILGWEDSGDATKSIWSSKYCSTRNLEQLAFMGKKYSSRFPASGWLIEIFLPVSYQMVATGVLSQGQICQNICESMAFQWASTCTSLDGSLAIFLTKIFTISTGADRCRISPINFGPLNDAFTICTIFVNLAANKKQDWINKAPSIYMSYKIYKCVYDIYT